MRIAPPTEAGIATPMKVLREVRLQKTENVQAYQVGQTLTVDVFTPGEFVDVVGETKGKGFQGGAHRQMVIQLGNLDAGSRLRTDDRGPEVLSGLGAIPRSTGLIGGLALAPKSLPKGRPHHIKSHADTFARLGEGQRPMPEPGREHHEPPGAGAAAPPAPKVMAGQYALLN